MPLSFFEPYLQRWSLTPDGAPIVTPSGRLLPVRQNGVPAMLKVAQEQEERYGCGLMVWWDGGGAAKVLAHDDGVLLMERAMGPRSLVTMARSGEDDAATRILCDVAETLHAPRGKSLPDLIPLERWFEALLRAGPSHGGLLAKAAEIALILLAEPQEIAVLHADLHHANVLDFGDKGWLAIDPKRVIGERGFDYANIFSNPDAMNDGGAPVATLPGRLARQADIVAKAARLDRARLIQWIVAYSALSAIWCLEDNLSGDLDLTIVEIATAELGRG